MDITPSPSDAEREAILEALAAEDEGRPAPSAWAKALLPERGGDDPEP